MPKLPRIEHGDGGAFYHNVLDYINMPQQGSFSLPEDYYATLFHELVHSTGHDKRLGRKELMSQEPFGSEPYCKEELVAEIGASFLKSVAGIAHDDFEQNAAYLKSWLDMLKADSRIIVHASGQAQKAVDYILNIVYDHEKEAE
jgi:antirestriction protein ArdC